MRRRFLKKRGRTGERDSVNDQTQQAIGGKRRQQQSDSEAQSIEADRHPPSYTGAPPAGFSRGFGLSHCLGGIHGVRSLELCFYREIRYKKF
jgi:hypothetical protein